MAARADTPPNGATPGAAPAPRGLLARVLALLRRSEAQIVEDVFQNPTRRTL